MKKFIEIILKNQTFLDVFYNFENFYNNSEYEQNMNDFYNSSDEKIRFISKNTEWLFITDDGECYGILNKFVIKVDSEGHFSYICHGFENLAEYLLKDKLNLLNAKYYCEQNNTTLENVLNEYNIILNKYNLIINLVIDEQEFEDYLKRNGV